jgi:hypothetical protein
MNSKRSVRWALLAGASTCAALAMTTGCELIVDFDRSKIPTAADASLGDAAAPDATSGDDGTTGEDGGEAGAADGGLEAGPDATVEEAGTTDGGDAGKAGETGAPEAGVADTGTDAPIEAASGDDADTDASDQ